MNTHKRPEIALYWCVLGWVEGCFGAAAEHNPVAAAVVGVPAVDAGFNPRL